VCDPLPITGERTVPGVWHENYWLRRHEVVYAWVAHRVAAMAAELGRAPVVLDAGCGEGYGTASLATHQAHALALDYDAFTAAHLAQAYPGLPAVRANLVALPLRRESVDMLVSLQTIEHLWDQEEFLAECSRVLRAGGLLVLSTPNRHTFPPGNIFHHRELDARELTDLLVGSFDDVSERGVHHGPRTHDWESLHGSIVQAQIEVEPQAWSDELASAVRGTETEDFEIRDDTDDSRDLIATAHAR